MNSNDQRGAMTRRRLMAAAAGAGVAGAAPWAFAKEAGKLRQEASQAARRADMLAGATAFKGVVLEGVVTKHRNPESAHDRLMYNPVYQLL